MEPTSGNALRDLITILHLPPGGLEHFMGHVLDGVHGTDDAPGAPDCSLDALNIWDVMVLDVLYGHGDHLDTRTVPRQRP